MNGAEELPGPRQILDAAIALARPPEAGESTDQFAGRFIQLLVRLTGADQGTFGLVRDDEVVIIAAETPPRTPVGSHFPVGFGVAGWVAATHRAAEIPDVRRDRRYVTLPYPEVRSFIALPLLVDERAVVAVASLAAWAPDAFPTGLAEALQPLASMGALLLQRTTREAGLRNELADLREGLQARLENAVHELKAPLNAAAGFLEIVSREQAGPLNAQQRDFLEIAHAEATRVLQGLAGIVEASAAVHQRPLALRPADLATIGREAVRRAQGQALARGVRLALETPTQPLPVAADEAALLQVLANLIQNAFRVAPRGSTIALSLVARHGYACAVLDDEGPGIPPDQVEHVFERYGQAGATPRAPGEVGLGLWLSHAIVDQHGGLIWAENRPDGGARFCVALPLRQ